MVRILTAGVALAIVVSAGPAAAPAADTIRLGGFFSQADTMTLDGKGDADTLEVGRGFDGGHGVRGYSSHSFRGGYAGGFRGYSHGYNRSYARSYGYYRPYYRSNFYGSYYPRYSYPYYNYGYSYPYYYSSPAYYSSPSYYSPPIYYCPTGGGFGSMPYATTLTTKPQVIELQPGDGTYPYDGGPQNPVPMPKAEPGPASVPPPQVPVEGRVVSLRRAATPKYTYRAYGDHQNLSPPARPSTITVTAGR